MELSEVGRTWEALKKGKVGLKYIACIFFIKNYKKNSLPVIIINRLYSN